MIQQFDSEGKYVFRIGQNKLISDTRVGLRECRCTSATIVEMHCKSGAMLLAMLVMVRANSSFCSFLSSIIINQSE